MFSPFINSIRLPEGDTVSYILTPYNKYELAVSLGNDYQIVSIENAKVYLTGKPGGLPSIDCSHLMKKDTIVNPDNNTVSITFTCREVLSRFEEVHMFIDNGQLHYYAKGGPDRTEANLIVHVTVKYSKVKH